ncbi:MAG TPA: MFS transporter, partial [Pyrinomonadaceae bacterium]|nr:MFS transporter [Pyrinomonadaceae bacterium]
MGQYGWRAAFMIVGFPGIVFAVLVYLLREPQRRRVTATETNYSSSDWKRLLSNKSFVLLCAGYALFGLATNNLSIWGATFYFQYHKFDLATIGFYGGILTLVAGIPAT